MLATLLRIGNHSGRMVCLYSESCASFALAVARAYQACAVQDRVEEREHGVVLVLHACEREQELGKRPRKLTLDQTGPRGAVRIFQVDAAPGQSEM